MDGTAIKGNSANNANKTSNRTDTALNISDLDTAAKMLDKLSRVADDRKITPLSRYDYISYTHRMYDGINGNIFSFQLGDVWFMVPPEFIMVTSESQTGKIVTLRQENTQKTKSGYHRRSILVDLVAHGSDQINGYRVESPAGHYYVDGIRPLLAQFKRTPFLPVFNELINNTYGIHTVALQSITIQTVENFPDVMTAQLTLQEVNMMPYIEMHSFQFQFMIDWDLMRFYYQSALTEDHEYKKLQSIPVNKKENHLVLRTLGVDALNNYIENKDNDRSVFLNIITNKENYDTWIDSSQHDFHIVNFSCNYSNMLVNLQMSEADSPTVQFMGGMDTIYNIVIETKDESIISNIVQGQINNDLLTRDNVKLRSLGFVMLESELVELTGSLFVMIDTVTFNTVPGFPGLYNIQITCVAYDIGQSEREQLEGFLPFDKNSFDATIEKKQKETTSTNKVDSEHPSGYDLVTQTQTHYEKQAEEDGITDRVPKITEQNYYINCDSIISAEIFPPTNEEDDWIPSGLTASGPADIYSMYVREYQNLKNGSTVWYDSKAKLLYIQKNDSKENPSLIDSSFLAQQLTEQANEDEYYNEYKQAQCIEQSESGLHTKITQDLYAERQIRTKMEVYPDLHLPTYEEVNNFIPKIQAFRSSHEGLSSYPLNQYPIQPHNAYFGCLDTADGLDDAFHPSDLLLSGAYYQGYVDPDFYVFYTSYNDYKNEYVDGDAPSLDSRSFSSRTKTVNDNNAAISERYIGNDPTNIATASDDIIRTACSIIGQNENGSKYDSINTSGKYDICAIGKYQFRGNRAKELLQDIIKSNSSLALERLGQTLYDYIQEDTNWENPRKNIGDSAGVIRKLLSEESTHNIQETRIYENVSSAMQYAMSKGLTDKKALIFYAELEHHLGRSVVSNVLLDGVNGYDGAKGNTLDAIYKSSIRNITNLYNDRRTNVYEALKSLNLENLSSALTSSSTVYSLSEADKLYMVNAVYYLIQGNVDLYKDSMRQIQMCAAQCFFDNFVEGGVDVSETWGQFLTSVNPTLNVSDLGLPDDPTGYESFKEGMLKAIDDVFINGQKAAGYSNCSFHVMSNMNYPDETNYEHCANDITSDFNSIYTNFSHNHQSDNPIEPLVTYTGIRFWGCKTPSPTDITFVNAGVETNVVKDQTKSSIRSTNINYNIESLGPSDVKYFGECLIAKTKRLNTDKEFVKNVLNEYKTVYNSCFTDMYQYSARGRLVRAFPAFLFCILDDQAQWYDGRKLWTNYYVYQSVTDIQIHATNDMPVETAVITITNSVNNLGKTQAGLSGYTVSNDPEYLSSRARWFYKRTGMIIGGIKLTNKLIELHQELYDHARLREGARIHLRIGYGSDPFSLAPVMNGHISDITIGDQITMIVTSDGHELVKTVVSAKSETNNGFLGLFGLGATQESSNLIAKMMVERSSWMNHLFKNWYEASKYGLEHFGIYFHNRGKLSNLINLQAVEDLWNECKEHWDILMNIYVGNYQKELYCVGTDLWFFDGEKNIIFDKYNMVPWDLAQICTQQVPEYICKVLRHQFDSRLFFGLPSHMERYRYDFFGGSPETVTTVTPGVPATPATTEVIGGDKDSLSGKFDNDTYDSGKVPIKGGGANVERVKFTVQFEKSHTLTNQQTKETPDKIQIYGIDANGNETVIAERSGNLRGRKAWDISVPGEFASSSGSDLSKFVNFRFHAYSCHDKEHMGKSCCEKAQIIRGEIIYKEGTVVSEGQAAQPEVKKTEISYSNILYEECKAAAQVHYIESITNIIDDQLRVTNKFSNTNVKCLYIRGKKVVATPLLKSDDTIDAAYQKTAIIDTSIVQNYLGPDALWEWLGIADDGKQAARRVGISNLLYGWQQQYQGEIIMFGNPGIKPHDYIMVNDTFANIYGLCICREVTHSFNSSTGFTTSVTPGMIGFDTQENSGLVAHCQNLLATLNAFSMLTSTRLYQVHLIEQYITEISNQLSILNRACDLLAASQSSAGAAYWSEKVLAWTGLAFGIYRVVTTAVKAGDIIAYGTKILEAVQAGFSGLSTASGILSKVGILARGVGLSGHNAIGAALGFGPHTWIVLAAVLVMKKVASVVIQYFSDRNCVVLMPLLWENYPFVSGVKDGERILLTASNANGTGENDGSDGNHNPNTPEQLSNGNKVED